MRRFKKVSLSRNCLTKLRSVGTHVAYRPKYELYKIRWEFNPYDDDFNPRWSIPHGDDIYPKYHSLKLNADNGLIYTARGHEMVGRLSKNDHNRLLSDPKFIEVRKEALKYRSNYQKQVKREISRFVTELECFIAK